jgi:hypothetical protein
MSRCAQWLLPEHAPPEIIEVDELPAQARLYKT